jgi:chemotaxis protein MotC
MLACDAADLDAGNISNVNTPGCHVADLGNPQIVETVLRLSPLPRVNDGLIKGLLAYSRGISEADKTWLAEIDPRSLAPRGAAHLALRPGNADCGGASEQGDLLSGSGPHLAPGTLLEEAALRRETVITALMEDFEKFEMLTSQYLRRFGDSVYAPEFTGRFAVAVATGRYAEDDAVLQGLLRTLDAHDGRTRSCRKAANAAAGRRAAGRASGGYRRARQTGRIRPDRSGS